MKKIVSVILTLALALGLALPAVAEDAIKIGVIGPLTGPAAIYGTAVVNAAKIAADEVNALGGLQIEIDAQDDEHDPEKAINAYNTVLDNGAKLIVGTVTSGPCAAGGGGSPPCWTGPSASRRGWRCCSSPCGGGRGSCGSTAFWGPWVGWCCSSPASPRSWPRSGISGPRRRRRQSALPCCRCDGWGVALKKWKSSAKTSFIFGKNGLQ